MSGAQLVGTSSAERTLDQRELASWRPAKENAPRPRKPRVLREVTNGIVCFCGERFGEHQALEFMLHLRAEVGDDLEVLERNRARHRVANMKPEQAERQRNRMRALRADPEYRARQREQDRAYARKRMLDPEHRKLKAARERERRARRKAERDALAQQP